MLLGKTIVVTGIASGIGARIGELAISLGADVIGLDWRVPLDQGWSTLGHAVAVQGNLDPIALFANEDLLRQRVRQILEQAAGRPGHIFNLGHGIVPGTPVENVQRVVQYVREFSAIPGDHSRA